MLPYHTHLSLLKHMLHGPITLYIKLLDIYVNLILCKSHTQLVINGVYNSETQYKRWNTMITEV